MEDLGDLGALQRYCLSIYSWVRKGKVQLELNLVRGLKGKDVFYKFISSKRKTLEEGKRPWVP